MTARNQSTLESRLATLAFVVLIVFSGISVALWRVHRVSFVSVHTATSQFLKHGDAVMTKPAELKQLQTGDLVSYYDPLDTTHIVTTRLQSVLPTNNAFIPSGSHEALWSALLIGKVQYRFSYMGYFLDFVRSRIGLVVGVYLPALIVVGNELKLLATAFDRKIYRLFAVTAER